MCCFRSLRKRREGRVLARRAPGEAGETRLGHIVQRTRPAQSGNGEDWGLSWQGEGLETPATPCPGAPKQGAALADVVAGSFLLPSSSQFRVSPPQCELPGNGCLISAPPPTPPLPPAAQRQSWGLLLLPACGNGLGSPLRASPSSQRPPLPREERERRAPHRRGLHLLMLVFALSKTALPATKQDSGMRGMQTSS